MQQPVNQAIGICGIQLVDADGRVSRSCARFPTAGMMAARAVGLDRFLPSCFPSYLMSDWPHRESRQVDHVCGAFFLIRRSLFDALGGFDERYFVYLEDLDLSLKAHRAGWSSYYLAEARMFHKGGGTSNRIKGKRLFYSLRSRIQYGCKWFCRAGSAWVVLTTLLIEPLARFARAFSRLSYEEIKETAEAFGLLWRDASALRARRGASAKRLSDAVAPFRLA
jgi:GT2 family glycosyltransferase